MPINVLLRQFPEGDSRRFHRRIEILHPLLSIGKNISPFAKLQSNEVIFYSSFPSEVVQLRYLRESLENHGGLFVVKTRINKLQIFEKNIIVAKQYANICDYAYL